MKGKSFEEHLIENAYKKLEELVENARNLVDFSEKDFQILANRKEILLSWSDEFAHEFYETLLRYPKTAKIFERISVEVVKERFKKWYVDLVSGKGGEEFYKEQFFIGLVHIHNKIDNNLMIFMANHLKRHFLGKAFKSFQPEEAIYVFQAFSKLVDFVVALTVEGYIFTLYEGLLDVAGLKPSLVERMMKLKLEEIYKIFKKDFVVHHD
ncbi:MAG TPA: hypothetical protein EYH48_05070 [Aquifex aeolicus]|nr:hypothetical protein [Aquifex aeolicus]